MDQDANALKMKRITKGMTTTFKIFLMVVVHRNIVIDRPQQHAEDDQDDH